MCVLNLCEKNNPCEKKIIFNSKVETVARERNDKSGVGQIISVVNKLVSDFLFVGDTINNTTVRQVTVKRSSGDTRELFLQG